jgi:hypothetical protein
MTDSVIEAKIMSWLIETGEPWTRYLVERDLVSKALDDHDLSKKRRLISIDPAIVTLLSKALTWNGDTVLKRHNDAAHPLYAISTLADFGLTVEDPGIEKLVGQILVHQSVEGAFQSLANYPTTFGGSGKDEWLWAACDAPTLLYALQAFGIKDKLVIDKATVHLLGLGTENGWQCACDSALGKFRGPGRKDDPCPIATLLALKAISLAPEYQNQPVVEAGIEMLLKHWQFRAEKKYYLFGIGTDFKKIKYPYVWYDILHVVEVLSRYRVVHNDFRFEEMLAVLFEQADEDGRHTAGSMYRSWKGWSFADKKIPSPWLTFLVARIKARVGSCQGDNR